MIQQLDDLILKIQKEPNYNEIKLQQKASNMNLMSVKREIKLNRMHLLDVSLEDYIKDDSNSPQNKRQMIEKIIIKLQQLNKIPIMHNDSLTRNFMIKNEDPFIIDFGQSTTEPSKMSDFNRYIMSL
jgi:tRNA A-37 threonylcarbamoyl transferase component Bud32